MSSGVTIATWAAGSSVAWCLTTGTVTAPPPTTSAQHAPTATFCTVATLPPPSNWATTAHGLQLASRRRREGRSRSEAWCARHSRHVHRCRRAISLARTPPDAASSSASRTEKHDVSRAGRSAQVRAGAGEQRAGRVDGRVEPPGDLLVREPVERAHHQHRLLPVGQAVDVPEQRTGLGAVDEHLGELAADGAGSASSSTSPATPRTRARRSSSRQALRTRRSSQARASIGTTPARKAAVRAQVDVLQHVVGVVAAAAQHPPRLPAQHGAMTLELGGERVLVASGRGDPPLGSWGRRVVDSGDARPEVRVAFSMRNHRTV